MENNNDPSTGSGANKNQNVKELTDEQLKEVAGGVILECAQKVAECKAIPDCDQQTACLKNLKKNGCHIIAIGCTS